MLHKGQRKKSKALNVILFQLRSLVKGGGSEVDCKFVVEFQIVRLLGHLPSEVASDNIEASFI